MLELIVGILAISAVVKIASADGQSGLLWGLVTFGLIVACMMLVPLPFLRVGLAGVLALVAMFGYKVVANR